MNVKGGRSSSGSEVDDDGRVLAVIVTVTYSWDDVASIGGGDVVVVGSGGY